MRILEMEGFICPNCFIDFKSLEKLSDHYINCIIKQTKNINLKEEHANPQIIGIKKSWTMEYRTLHESIHKKYAIYKNTLLIRLEKLLTEQTQNTIEIVCLKNPMIDTNESKSGHTSCMKCSVKFNFFNRSTKCHICNNVSCSQCVIDIKSENFFHLLKKNTTFLNKQLKLCYYCNEIMQNSNINNPRIQTSNKLKEIQTKILEIYEFNNKVIDENIRYMKEINESGPRISSSTKMFIGSLKNSLLMIDSKNKEIMLIHHNLININNSTNKDFGFDRLSIICRSIKQKALQHSEDVVIFISDYNF